MWDFFFFFFHHCIKCRASISLASLLSPSVGDLWNKKKSVEVLKVSWVMSIALLLYIVCVFFIIPVNLKHLKWFYFFFFFNAVHTFYRDCSIAHLWSSSLTCLTCWQKTLRHSSLELFFSFLLGRNGILCVGMYASVWSSFQIQGT